MKKTRIERLASADFVISGKSTSFINLGIWSDGAQIKLSAQIAGELRLEEG